MALNTISLHWFDEDGADAVHTYHPLQSEGFPEHANQVDLFAKIGACSNAGLILVSTIASSSETDAPDPGPYDASDKLVVQWRDSLGNVTSLQVAAPIEEVFADSDHALPQALSSPLNDFLIEVGLIIVSKGAEALVTYIKAYRSKKN